MAVKEISVKTGKDAFKEISRFLFGAEIIFDSVRTGFNGADVFTFKTSDQEGIFVQVFCSKGNSRVEAVEVIDTNENDSKRHPLLVLIEKPVEIEQSQSADTSKAITIYNAATGSEISFDDYDAAKDALKKILADYYKTHKKKSQKKITRSGVPSPSRPVPFNAALKPAAPVPKDIRHILLDAYYDSEGDKQNHFNLRVARDTDIAEIAEQSTPRCSDFWRQYKKFSGRFDKLKASKALNYYDVNRNYAHWDSNYATIDLKIRSMMQEYATGENKPIITIDQRLVNHFDAFINSPFLHEVEYTIVDKNGKPVEHHKPATVETPADAKPRNLEIKMYGSTKLIFGILENGLRIPGVCNLSIEQVNKFITDLYRQCAHSGNVTIKIDRRAATFIDSLNFSNVRKALNVTFTQDNRLNIENSEEYQDYVKAIEADEIERKQVAISNKQNFVPFAFDCIESRKAVARFYKHPLPENVIDFPADAESFMFNPEFSKVKATRILNPKFAKAVSADLSPVCMPDRFSTKQDKNGNLIFYIDGERVAKHKYDDAFTRELINTRIDNQERLAKIFDLYEYTTGAIEADNYDIRQIKASEVQVRVLSKAGFKYGSAYARSYVSLDDAINAALFIDDNFPEWDINASVEIHITSRREDFGPIKCLAIGNGKREYFAPYYEFKGKSILKIWFTITDVNYVMPKDINPVEVDAAEYAVNPDALQAAVDAEIALAKQNVTIDPLDGNGNSATDDDSLISSADIELANNAATIEQTKPAVKTPAKFEVGKTYSLGIRENPKTGEPHLDTVTILRRTAKTLLVELCLWLFCNTYACERDPYRLQKTQRRVHCNISFYEKEGIPERIKIDDYPIISANDDNYDAAYAEYIKQHNSWFEGVMEREKRLNAEAAAADQELEDQRRKERPAALDRHYEMLIASRKENPELSLPSYLQQEIADAAQRVIDIAAEKKAHDAHNNLFDVCTEKEVSNVATVDAESTAAAKEETKMTTENNPTLDTANAQDTQVADNVARFEPVTSCGCVIPPMVIKAKFSKTGKARGYYVDGIRARKNELHSILTKNRYCEGWGKTVQIDYRTYEALEFFPKFQNQLEDLVVTGYHGETLMTLPAAHKFGKKTTEYVGLRHDLYKVKDNNPSPADDDPTSCADDIELADVDVTIEPLGGNDNSIADDDDSLICADDIELTAEQKRLESLRKARAIYAMFAGYTGDPDMWWQGLTLADKIRRESKSLDNELAFADFLPALDELNAVDEYQPPIEHVEPTADIEPVKTAINATTAARRPKSRVKVKRNVNGARIFYVDGKRVNRERAGQVQCEEYESLFHSIFNVGNTQAEYQLTADIDVFGPGSSLTVTEFVACDNRADISQLFGKFFAAFGKSAYQVKITRRNDNAFVAGQFRKGDITFNESLKETAAAEPVEVPAIDILEGNDNLTLLNSPPEYSPDIELAKPTVPAFPQRVKIKFGKNGQKLFFIGGKRVVQKEGYESYVRARLEYILARAETKLGVEHSEGITGFELHTTGTIDIPGNRNFRPYYGFETYYGFSLRQYKTLGDAVRVLAHCHANYQHKRINGSISVVCNRKAKTCMITNICDGRIYYDKTILESNGVNVTEFAAVTGALPFPEPIDLNPYAPQCTWHNPHDFTITGNINDSALAARYCSSIKQTATTADNVKTVDNVTADIELVEGNDNSIADDDDSLICADDIELAADNVKTAFSAPVVTAINAPVLAAPVESNSVTGTARITDDGNLICQFTVNNETVTYFNGKLHYIWSGTYHAGFDARKNQYIVEVQDGLYKKFLRLDVDEFFQMMIARGACSIDTPPGDPQPADNGTNFIAKRQRVINQLIQMRNETQNSSRLKYIDNLIRMNKFAAMNLALAA